MKNWLMLVMVTLIGVSSAQAMPIIYKATLTGAASNTPSPGTGLATLEYDATLHTLLVDVSFAGLIGTVSAAHIHCCIPAPGNVGVATTVPTFTGFPSGVTSGVYNHLLDLSLASSFNPSFVTSSGGAVSSAEMALLSGLNNGSAYFNIHTAAYAGGEIRGFFAVVPTSGNVPEPATLSLLGLGIASLVISRRKREI
ncbi:CHRD domain-containing protein [Sulfurirhabdus autotrophica]|uniref:Putative secreted protein with PEP-CTERM sorting signal n=1 Tax=Sulfurirhabdus autotrophica TaxID=1706046 RepID=A0A4R3YAJ0_9PROT|nr:CHRD domain-containing protein [Sulfurirhabdus autotrophica]TCV89017.1 putative secreted protein with PEP-CTERM sorting signal [Sulfurirhabdus autotrophica]